TAAAIIELDGQRWYRTGDKGHLDEDGFLTIVDRYSRFAKPGGEMISLTTVEDQVRRAAGKPDLDLVAVSVPDEKKGERIVILVAGDIDAGEVKQALLEAKCSPLSIPEEFRTVDEIPRLGSGKTDFAGAKALALQSAVN